MNRPGLSYLSTRRAQIPVGDLDSASPTLPDVCLREVRSLALARSPHVVEMLTFGAVDGGIGIAMELGRLSLEQFIERVGEQCKAGRAEGERGVHIYIYICVCVCVRACSARRSEFALERRLLRRWGWTC